MKIFLIVFFKLLIISELVFSQQSTQPNHVAFAEDLVSHMNQNNTSYKHKKGAVAWKSKTSDYYSFTDCSGFLNALLRKTYGFRRDYFRDWLGTARPLAFQYFEAIDKENGFTKIQNVNDIKAGDFIAIKYVDRSEHDNNTGHCMLVDALPQMISARTTVSPNTKQYEVLVIDSSKSPHGNDDTRHLSKNNFYDGLGKGKLRLYADADGKIVGYSWSKHKPKKGFNPLENPILSGRLKL